MKKSKASRVSPKQRAAIRRAMTHCREMRPLFEAVVTSFSDVLRGDEILRPLTHHVTHRLKGDVRLQAKIERKVLEGKRIDDDNVFMEVNDIAGMRLVHLHTDQVGSIDRRIRELAAREEYKIIEGPVAHCWDQEYVKIYKDLGMTVSEGDSMYSSVHYVLLANEKNRVTFELQVRTLTDEVWGAVSHKTGYEDHVYDPSVAAQLGVLARITTGATRLIDSIFASYDARIEKNKPAHDGPRR